MAVHTPVTMRCATRYFSFGAIGEEVKAARGEYFCDYFCDGGVMLESPSVGSDGTESLRDLVEDSEPLVEESPRAARLLAANRNRFYFEDSPISGSPESFHSDRVGTAHSRVLPASPTPQRHQFNLEDLESLSCTAHVQTAQSIAQHLLREQSQACQPRARSSTIFSNISSTSTGDQKSYKELFNNINDKIDLAVRKYVGVDSGVAASLDQVEAFIDLAARHVNYRKVAIGIGHTLHLQPALVHGMIWRLVNETIFDKPVLDQTPSPYAEAFLTAWNRDVNCCTIEADDWSIKGPLMEARIVAARRVFENTPKFNDWIKAFAFEKTDYIVNKLAIAWPESMKSQVRSDLNEPITKLLRIAIRMRGEMKAFEFKFYEYGTKASSDHMVLNNEFAHLAPPRPEEDENHHVICTKIPQVFEKDYRPQSKSKTCFYKAEVIAREKYPGYLDNLGDRYRRSTARRGTRTPRYYAV